jgi:hypothetical protein
MSHEWTIYVRSSTDEATRVVRAVYEDLDSLLGSDLVRRIERDEEYPAALGAWPSLVVSKGPVPTPDEERAALEEPGKRGVTFEAAAVARLGECRARIDIQRPTAFDEDPTLVTTLRLIFHRLEGGAVFCRDRGFDLATSETILERLATHRDLAAALREQATSAEPDEVDLSSPQSLHRMLAGISERKEARRAARALLDEASPVVQRLMTEIARSATRSDEELASSLGLTTQTVAEGRAEVLDILRRALAS